ncbi:hypothetical protein JOE21_002527 [Desmospora profundinema]|uniref:Uncharacterized protein n=1 Tax=Desmospora profundinema TaxID=1571184 RepID=A0ABU1IP05_9BACL|nr:hypothetical protein [Desmospora profundinema]
MSVDTLSLVERRIWMLVRLAMILGSIGLLFFIVGLIWFFLNAV